MGRGPGNGRAREIQGAAADIGDTGHGSPNGLRPGVQRGSLRDHPGFSAVAILSLGFGIGAGFVAIAVVAAATLLRPEGSLPAEEGRAEAGSADHKPAYSGEPSGSSNA